jgi:hypothetical protein
MGQRSWLPECSKSKLVPYPGFRDFAFDEHNCSHVWRFLKTPPKSDVQLLIRESGGSVQPSLVSAIKLIQSASFQRGGKKVVFLCDDSTR